VRLQLEACKRKQQSRGSKKAKRPKPWKKKQRNTNGKLHAWQKCSDDNSK
jgi:hypothetical protein